MRTDSLKKIFKGIGVAAGWILIWQLVSMFIGKELLVPAPLKVMDRLLEMAVTLSFWEITSMTVFRIAVGFTLGTIAGMFLAVITAGSKITDAFLRPAQTVIRATPIASFIILALIWIKGGHIPSFISFLMVMPIVWSNTYSGIKETDKKLLEMADIYGFSPFEKVKYIYFHSVLPYFAAAATTSMGLAWKAGIAAEVLALPEMAVGTSIFDSKIYLETVDLFAWSFVVIVFSIILEKIITSLLKKAKGTTSKKEVQSG